MHPRPATAPGLLRRARAAVRRSAASWSSRSTPTRSAASTRSSGRPGRTVCRACAASGRARSASSSRMPPGSSRCTRRRPRSPTTSPIARGAGGRHRGGRRRGAAVDRGHRDPTRCPAVSSSCPAGAAHRVDRLVVCAGLQADRVSRWVDDEAGPRIVPFRGEYMTVAAREARRSCAGMVYPVPDPRYPFLGVHFTRRVSGELEVGPNAVLALRREGYGSVRRHGAPTCASIAGLARLLADGPAALADRRQGGARLALEARVHARCRSGTSPRSASRTWSAAAPGSAPRPSSATAAWSTTSASPSRTASPCVRNAPSPAATSSLAIAEHVADRVLAS